MKESKLIKTILFSFIYGINLFFALSLWLCGKSGNILFGIILIILYRLSLWFSPIAVTIVCWLPLKPKLSVRKKLLLNLVHLAFCGILFTLCFLLLGNWY